MKSTARKSKPTRRLLSCALASCLLLGAAPAFAQSTGATIRGQVMADSSPAAQAQVTATNTATGLTRTVQSTENGSYSLAGLPPGTYKVDVNAGGKTTTQNITVQVGQTATVNLGVGGVGETAEGGAATTLDAVQVTAQAAVETKTSEVATYITQKQMQALPQNSRNFLSFADLVPGVAFNTGTDGSSSIRSGAQLSSGINVFIDGVGQKDYVLKGGVTGQDSSRGNPFPQLGISEYKVVTSNYKAEYDQLSSAGITAVTRSGTNEFHGDFFWDNVASSWVADTIREKDGRAIKPHTRDEQYGFALGGPLIKDRLHFFVTYEAKDRSDARQVVPGRQFEIEDLPERFREAARSTNNAPFKEDLYFGKLSWTPGDAHLVELTMKRREEDETTNVGGINLASYGTLKSGEETRVDLRYQFNAENWMNDAHLTYEDSNFAPRPISPALIGYKLLVPRRGEELLNNPAMEEVINSGGGGDYQRKGQKGYSFQDDFTFFGWEGHTVKLGVKYKDVDLNAFEQTPYSPQYRYDLTRSLEVPYMVQFTASGSGYPTSVASSVKQLGLYLQDDWEVNEHLTLNLGVRWDYETNPAYEDHVTPAALVSALRAWPNINNGNVDYDYNRYISTGGNRSAFKGGWQPRVGFSYDIAGDQRHVIFGGAGRSYNRNQFDYLSYEKYRLAFQRYEYQFNVPGHACAPGVGNCLNFDPSMLDSAVLAQLAAANPNNGSEVFLLNNDIKTPYSDQFSLGMRNSFGMFGHDWNSSITLLHVLSHDGILWTMGNRYPNGEFRSDPGVAWGGQPWGEQLPGWGRFFLGNNAVETRLNSLLLSLDKPYTNDSRWGVSVSYTYSDAKENRSNSDQFSFDYANLDDVAFTRALGIPRHRLVATGMADFWGLTASAKLVLESPKSVEATNCYAVSVPGQCYFDPFTPDKKIGFKQLDLALQKEWDTGTDLKLRVRGDVLNVFNWRNVFSSQYANWRGADGVADPTYGERTGDEIALPTRTFKLSFGLTW